MQPRNKNLSREELLQSWLQQKNSKDAASAKENSGAAGPPSALKKMPAGSSGAAAGLSEISASSINTANSMGKRSRESSAAAPPSTTSSSSANSSSSSSSGGGGAVGGNDGRRKSVLVTAVASNVPSYARPLKSSSVNAPPPALAAGNPFRPNTSLAASCTAATPSSAAPASSVPSFTSAQAATIESSPASSSSSPAVSSSSSQQQQADVIAATSASAPSSSLLLVAAAQKLLHEQQRADSLSKANREADAEIAALRASVHEQQQQLQQLQQALTAAGVASPSVSAQPAAAEVIQAQKEQYMAARDQLLWEEQQHSVRCASSASNCLLMWQNVTCLLMWQHVFSACGRHFTLTCSPSDSPECSNALLTKVQRRLFLCAPSASALVHVAHTWSNHCIRSCQARQAA
jgi:hypothetical protein